MSGTAENLRKRLDAMIETVREACRRTESGTLADLGHLDEDVARLCADVERAAPDDAHAVGAAMGDMISALEDLARALKEFQDRAAQRKD